MLFFAGIVLFVAVVGVLQTPPPFPNHRARNPEF
jgi:hypothetical protein